MSNYEAANSKPRYLWPWLLLTGVLLGVVLAVVWITVAARRVRQQRQFEFTPPAKTNSGRQVEPRELQFVFVVEQKRRNQVV
jgi:uncharacterized membrane protein